jgi:hypothetical protein
MRRRLRTRRRSPLAVLGGALFFGYVGALVGAGAWGALFAKTDMATIAGFHPRDELPERTAATVLSQHRFLRAMELGFGLFAMRSRERIETEAAWNRLFLSAMGFGIAVRAVGWVADGRPGVAPHLFAGYELVTIAVYFAHTRSTLRR